MALRKIEDDRVYVTVGWDEGDLKGDVVQYRGVNPDDPGDPSWRPAANDGSLTLSYPPGYEGETEVTVNGDEGTSVSALISVP